MRKSFFLVLLICSFWGLHAELNPPHRYFELGATANVAISNNWFSTTDFLSETLVVDFTEMSRRLNNGLDLNLSLSARTFLNVNVKSLVRVGVFAGIQGSGLVSISQSTIDYLGRQDSSQSKSMEAGATLDSLLYAEAGVNLQTFILNRLGLSISPSVFVPLVYIPATDINLSVTPSDKGTTIKSVADLSVYTAMPFNGQDATALQGTLDANTLGLDISLAAEYPILPFLDIGASVKNLSLISGKLLYQTTYSASFEYSTQQAMDSFMNKDKGGDSQTPAAPSQTSTTLDTPRSVKRPTSIGVAAVYRPLGDMITVRAALDLVVNKPVYLNFMLGGGLHLLRMSALGGHLFNLTLTTGYNHRQWIHALGIGLNLRVFELDLRFATCSSDFIKSLSGAGLGVGVGVRMGF